MTETTPKVGKKARNEFVDTIIVVVEALLIALVFRTFIYQPFSIPTASMQSTMMIGDYFVASKFAWGYGKYSFPIDVPMNGRILALGEPQVGDVAVFRNISNEDYIKRIIGREGDRIQMQEGRLYINGVMVEREEIGTATDTDSYGMSKQVKVYRETLPNGVSHVIQEQGDNLPLDNTREYVVPPGHFFMMGDNRDASQDSRVLSAVGYVPLNALIGKAEWRFFSIRDNIPPWQIWQWPGNVQLDRMFQSVYQ